MKQLTKKAEELLGEILEHRLENGNCDTDYWKDRFEEYSVSEDAIVRSLFKELREAGMISVSWYDDYPAVLMLLGNGVSYFEERNSNDELAAQSSSYVVVLYGVNGLRSATHGTGAPADRRRDLRGECAGRRSI